MVQFFKSNKIISEAMVSNCVVTETPLQCNNNFVEFSITRFILIIINSSIVCTWITRIYFTAFSWIEWIILVCIWYEYSRCVITRNIRFKLPADRTFYWSLVDAFNAYYSECFRNETWCSKILTELRIKQWLYIIAPSDIKWLTK